ncbi:MAG: MFS transporter [Dehalococcoidia bacterium]|nr:MFS transporter [Dehalococcoidia bacterium]
MSKYLIFASVSLVLLLSAINGTSVAVAFPEIISSFDTSLILAGWVLSVYQLVATVVMPIAGKANDIFGRKQTLMFFLGMFTLGSLLSAIAPNIPLLIASRLIQGIGGGGFLPSAAGIVADEFPRSRQRAIGLFTSIFPLGQIIGPNLGGWLTEAFGWRSIFWFNIPLAIAAFISAAVLLRPGQKTAQRIDIRGALLLAGSLSSFMVGLTELGNGDTPVTWTLAGLLFVSSIVFMVVFIRHEVRAEDPIIDLAVLKERRFMAANAYNFVYGAAVLGVVSFVPLYAISIHGMSVFASGIILTPRSVGMLLASTVTSIFMLRWGYRRPMLVGTAAIVLSLFLLAIATPGATVILGLQLSSGTLLLAALLLSGLGSGTSAPAANNACIELMPDRVATITGVRGMFRMGGGAIGIAIASLVLEHSAGDMGRGFYFIFLSLAVVMLLTASLIFAMPSSPYAQSRATGSKSGHTQTPG